MEKQPQRLSEDDQLMRMSILHLEAICQATSKPNAFLWLLVKLCEKGVSVAYSLSLLRFDRSVCGFCIPQEVERAKEVEEKLKAMDFQLPAHAIKALATMNAFHAEDPRKAAEYLSML